MQTALWKSKVCRKLFQFSGIQMLSGYAILQTKQTYLRVRFQTKFALPDLVENTFSFGGARSVTEAFVLVCKSHVCKTLRKINIYSGTGPDLLASRVLVECSEELSLPLAKFIRRIIALGFWPTAWTIHWLMLLYKRNAVSEQENYRAINLTVQISKAVKRYLYPFFAPILEERAFGHAKFAYRKRRGARYAVLYYVL